MEDYKFSESSNVGPSISSVEYSVVSTSQQSYFNTPSSVSDLVSSYQSVLKMQDDPLNENSSSAHSNTQNNCQQNSAENGNEDQLGGGASQTKDEGISMVNLGNGVQSADGAPEQREVSSITNNQLPAYSSSEPSLNVINSITSSNLWASNVDDSMIHNFNVSSAANGALTFPNFSPSAAAATAAADNTLYDPSLGNHVSGLSSSQMQQSQQRRNITTQQNYPHNLTRSLAQSNPQQNMYLANKMYNNSWNTSQNTWGPSVQNQNNINSLSAWNRGRSTPNLNPMQNLSNRKITPSFAQQQSMLMAQKFRRSTSYPGKNIFSQGNSYDITNVDDSADLILPYQDHTQLNNGNCYGGTGNGEVDNAMSPLDNMTALHQYLNELMRTGTDLNGDLMTKENRPFFPGLDEQAVAAIIENPSSHIVDGQVFIPSLPQGAQSSPHALLQEKEEKYSRKVFVGGLPPDIDEEEISNSFRRFGQLVVDWPHKAESKSFFPPKGYAFLLFQEESSVQTLIDSCIQEDDKLYLVVSSPTVKDKAVQIRPWRLNDADYVLNASLPLDPRKTVFVGGVPRPLKAIELATIMDRLYGCVCYAGIDTDPELKYPKGAGRVAFSNQQSYIAAISARFVQLQHGDIDKRVEVKPYVLDDQMCDECAGQRCGGKFAPFFCANVTCLQYYCEHCWGVIHSRSGREFHKPLVKEGAERPRPLQFRWC